jgi:hypothetical protein
MKQRKSSPLYILGLVLIAILAVTLISPRATARAAPAGPEAVIAWNQIMVQMASQQPAPASFVYASYAQAAVFNAVVAVEGGYQPYKSNIIPRPGASVDAAVATAAHDVLVHYFQSTEQKTTLDAAYQSFMENIPDGPAKSEGAEVGAEAAAELIALRLNDGLNTDIGFSMPPTGPGVWQLPEGTNPLVPWMSELQPFMLESPNQFRPGPPPALNSKEWVEQFNEVKAYGHRDSTVRTAEQANIAKFWTSVPVTQYNVAYQQIASSRDLSALEAARLMAMGNMVGADALIGCFDAKYHYLFWRPQYAIPQGHTDGNAQTVSDPSFVPLIGTPPHPEYPSAHNCLTAAEAEVFAEFLGTQRIELEIPSTVPGISARYYRTANDLTREIIDARVWGGIHYRVSDVNGATLGRKVAHWTLKRYFLPEN